MDFEQLRDSQSVEDDELTKEEKFSLGKSMGSILVSALLAVIIFFIVTIFYKPTLTSGSSMEPTLFDGDRAIASVFHYKPTHGDVVVIKDKHEDGKYIVKRIIGLEGDLINIDFTTGEVTRNGHTLVEQYVMEPTVTRGDIVFPILVPEGTAFVMGDNRNHSTDSRTSYTGMVPVENIEGKIVFRFFPGEKFGMVK